jgi:Protein of unknown function (DUF3043)
MLRRRSTVAAAEPESDTLEAVGKGRPTPKRADARKTRRAPAPKTRKEAAKLQRDKAREQRTLQRQGLRTGDTRHLPARDAGPGKLLARNVVDSHFTYGQVFFGLIFTAFVVGLTPNSIVREVSNIAALGSFVLMITDGLRNGRMAKRLVEIRFDAAEARGITLYALTRSMLPRWARRPPPQVKRGAAI